MNIFLKEQYNNHIERYCNKEAKCREMVDEKIIGNRIPNLYFFTKGKGETNFGLGDDPWHTGAFDIALLDAQIGNSNIMAYSSVIPPTAKEISIGEAQCYLKHGAVLESIISSINGCKGDTIVSGVGRIFVKDKSTNEIIGGFAAEYSKRYMDEMVPRATVKKVARESLEMSLRNIVKRRYDMREVEVCDFKIATTSLYIREKFGTCLAVIGFMNYILPIID